MLRMPIFFIQFTRTQKGLISYKVLKVLQSLIKVLFSFLKKRGHPDLAGA